VALAALALVGGLLAGFAQARSQWRAAAAEGEQEVAAAAVQAAQRLGAALAVVGAEAPELRPGRWDVDRFRRPLGRLADDGSVVAAALDADAARQATRDRRALTVASFAGLAVLALFGLGGVAALWRTAKRYRVAYAYAVPALAGMLVLVFFPFLYGIALSFTNSNIYNTDRPISETWVGFENFKEILGDFDLVKQGEDGRVVDYRNFYWTLGFNIVWTVANVAIGVALGLLLALALNTKGLAGRPVYRVILILPWAMPNYITALIWKGMFHQQFGVINQVVQIFGGSPISWFEHPLTSFATVLATNGWLSFPFMMVILLGALQSIPSDLYEAARVDGASRWQQFRSITMPSLKPALVPAVIISVIWTFNMFNIIYLVSQGEPGGATEILITQAYKIAFEQYRYGYAAAYSTVIFLILLTYGMWQNRATRATEAI
jgi:arabinogalactan oligomer/maltooligosaccharide transport system permease protein